MNTRQDLATLDEELAQQAAEIQRQVGQPESKKIAPDRNGNFIAAGGINLGSEIQIAVVDFCSANDFYVDPYDANNPKPPVCFARGYDLADMIPEDVSPEKQSKDCAGCPHNQFGSRGNGKACKNTRLVACVLANELDDPDMEPDLHLLSVPPTALKSFDAAMLQASRMFNATRLKVLLTVSIVAQGQYNTLQFSMPESNTHYGRLAGMRDAAQSLLGRLPDLTNYKPRAAARR